MEITYFHYNINLQNLLWLKLWVLLDHFNQVTFSFFSVLELPFMRLKPLYSHSKGW